MTYFVQFTHVPGKLTAGSQAIIYYGKFRQLVTVISAENRLLLKDNFNETIDIEPESLEHAHMVELSLCTRSNLVAGDSVYMDDPRIPARKISKIIGDTVYFEQGSPGEAIIQHVMKKIAVISEKALVFAKPGDIIDSSNLKLLAENCKTGDSRNINEFTEAPKPGEIVIALIRCTTCGDFK